MWTLVSVCPKTRSDRKVPTDIPFVGTFRHRGRVFLPLKQTTGPILVLSQRTSELSQSRGFEPQGVDTILVVDGPVRCSGGTLEPSVVLVYPLYFEYGGRHGHRNLRRHKTAVGTVTVQLNNRTYIFET